MVFLSICHAVYNYTPQGEGELPIQEGELVYILEKGTEDDWWKAKKKAPGEEDEEPVGLIPNNYVEEAQPIHHAKALYDYNRQTDEELSFSEDAALQVYDISDPDWTLVGLDGEYGFAPSNYIEITGAPTAESPLSVPSPRPTTRTANVDEPPTLRSVDSPPQSPAANLAGIIHNQASAVSPNARLSGPSSVKYSSQRPQYTPEASDEDVSTTLGPSLPQRPPSEQLSPPVTQYTSPRSPESKGITASPPNNRAGYPSLNEERGQRSPGGFHLYNISEMASAMGKKKKMPTTLGINLATGTIMIAPEKSRDGPQQEWTAEKLTHYSIEGKHVFMELVRPTSSFDFHAGAKDTAHEIVAALGELAGAVRAEGLREVIAAANSGSGSQKKGEILYDFMAQGDDEVTVATGDEVVVLNDTKSNEWWMVRRLKNGKEGVVPSSYVEVIHGALTAPSSFTGLNAGRSTVEQNRLEEERLVKEVLRSSGKRGGNDTKGLEVGPGMKLPQRGSSLMGGNDSNKGSSQRAKRDSRSDGKSSSSKPKPDVSKTRTWTDRSGSFKVDAEFIGLKDGKIHLHKLNGVKIAVPVTKMAVEDLEYVERKTGVSLDDEKPLSEIRRNSQKAANGNDRKKGPSSFSTSSKSVSNSGATIQAPKEPEYDWFDFFLKCGISPYQCERYAFSFNRDSMDEGVLSDITPAVLRTLGLKEGDIIRVMKFLDNKYGRTGAKSKLRNVSFSDKETIGNEEDGESGVASPSSTGGGLFSGPGGTLRNNTRKGRPAPAVQTNDTIDPKAFQSKDTDEAAKSDRSKKTPTTLVSTPKPIEKIIGGFDDDAWDVKPSKQQPNASQAPSTALLPVSTAPPQPTVSGALAELSLLSPPIEPTAAHTTGAQQVSQSQPPQGLQQLPAQQQQQQLQPPTQTPQPQQQQLPLLQGQQPQQLQQQATGANPSFFSQLGQQGTGQNYQPNSIPQAPPPPSYNSPQSGTGQQNFQLGMPPRQRPQAPQAMQQGSLMPPPPPRPLSAPQNVSQPNNFGPPPLQPQLTGVPYQVNNQNQLASSGPSLNDLNQMRLQQQYGQQQLQSQVTGFGQQGNNLIQYGNGMVTQPAGQQFRLSQQPTGFRPSPLFLNGQQTGSPFADPGSTPLTGGFQPMSAQSLNFSPSFQSPVQPQQTGSINSYLPPALQPTPTGTNGFNNQSGSGQLPPQPAISSVPPVPEQQSLAPLQVQKTGPAPPVRFGVANEAKKLMPQATGRKANLSQATPQNPFGF